MAFTMERTHSVNISWVNRLESNARTMPAFLYRSKVRFAMAGMGMLSKPPSWSGVAIQAALNSARLEYFAPSHLRHKANSTGSPLGVFPVQSRLGLAKLGSLIKSQHNHGTSLKRFTMERT